MARPTPRTPARPRDAEATRLRLQEAVGRLLAREGFASLGVNAVAREAGVDKVLIYRYYGGLDPLLEAWAEGSDFWPTLAEVAGPAPESDPARRVSGLLKRHLRALRARPHSQAVLAWEGVTRNPLTLILGRIREARAEQLMAALPESAHRPDLDLEALAALLGAGLQYLLLRSRTVEVFNGLPIGTEEGWTRLERALDQLCDRLFATSGIG